MDKEKKDVNINIVSKPVAATADGNALRIQDNGQAELTFFQVIGNHPDTNTVDAAAIASVRMTIGQLEQLKNTLNTALEQHSSKTSK